MKIRPFLASLLLSLVFSAGAAFAQLPFRSVTLVWTNDLAQSPADNIEIRSSLVLNSTPILWPVLVTTNEWTALGALPPGNAAFVLWLPGTNSWNRVTFDIETGKFYTNAVSLLRSLDITINPFINQFFVGRYTMNNGAPPGDFSNACQWQAAPTNVILFVQP